MDRARISTGIHTALLAALIASVGMRGDVMDSMFRIPSGSRGRNRRSGPGWTNRHAQRLAKKRRNVLRNRRAHRA